MPSITATAYVGWSVPCRVVPCRFRRAWEQAPWQAEAEAASPSLSLAVTACLSTIAIATATHWTRQLRYYLHIIY